VCDLHLPLPYRVMIDIFFCA